MKTLLLTGGAGYIGSHNAVLFLEQGYKIIILDNLSNSSRDVLENIEQIVATPPQSPSTKGEASASEQGELSFYQGDLRNITDIESVFSENTVDCVIHFAGLKSVGESCDMPHEYYENNIIGTMNLSKIMEKYNCKDIIFSSSATVYEPNQTPPFSEKTLTGNTTNPYGTSKFIIENILRDLAIHRGFRVMNLRYFNPVGAHSSGLIGEDPNDIPNNLLPYIMKVASGELTELSVYGDDYDTIDGSGVRDYIHVDDLASGHLAAYKWLSEQGDAGVFEVFNLGTGRGSSVLEMVKITEDIIGKPLPYSIVSRRSGDIASAYCNPEKANNLLGWKALKTVQEAVADSWKFITMQQGK